MARVSVFLAERCEALYQALVFFNTKHPRYTKDELRLIFLAQIDFWDFEVESLLFLFQSFQQRQNDWSSIDSIESKIRKHDLIIKQEYLSKVKQKRYWQRRERRKNSVWEPKVLLDKVIGLYNELLESSEYLLAPEIFNKTMEACGMKFKRLSSYQKKINEDYYLSADLEGESDES